MINLIPTLHLLGHRYTAFTPLIGVVSMRQAMPSCGTTIVEIDAYCTLESGTNIKTTVVIPLADFVTIMELYEHNSKLTPGRVSTIGDLPLSEK